jgi:predicted nucleic acid-binding protein
VSFVLDASVALSWLLRDASGKDEPYAFAVLKALRAREQQSCVPVTWGLELANVIARSEARTLVTQAQSDAFLEMLQDLDVEVDSDSAVRSLSDTLQVARRYGLSSYDASYLELAMRSALPLATLDADLRRAADKAGVKRFKP